MISITGETYFMVLSLISTCTVLRYDIRSGLRCRALF